MTVILMTYSMLTFFTTFTEGVYLSKRVLFFFHFFDLKKPKPNKDIGEHDRKNKKHTEFDH